MKYFLLLSAISLLLIAQPKPIAISFMQDVYAVSPYGDIPRMNPLWWASDQTAVDVSARLGAIAVARDTTPQTGPALVRWRVAHVPFAMLPASGSRVVDVQTLQMLLALPAAKMWASRFPNGCEVNTGYLADGIKRNTARQDGGIGYAQQVVAGECAVSAEAPGPTRRKAHKYPPLFADGRAHTLPPIPVDARSSK